MCLSVAPHPSQSRPGIDGGRSIDIWLLRTPVRGITDWIIPGSVTSASLSRCHVPLSRLLAAPSVPWTAVWDFVTLVAADIGHVTYRHMVTLVHVSYRVFRQVQTWSVWISRTLVFSSLSPLQGDAGHVVRTPSEVGHFGWYRLSDKSWLTPEFSEATSSPSVVTTACLCDDRKLGEEISRPFALRAGPVTKVIMADPFGQNILR